VILIAHFQLLPRSSGAWQNTGTSGGIKRKSVDKKTFVSLLTFNTQVGK
jgi:hypothetical protein